MQQDVSCKWVAGRLDDCSQYLTSVTLLLSDVPSVTCDFSEPHLCGYTQPGSDNFDWTRKNSSSGKSSPCLCPLLRLRLPLPLPPPFSLTHFFRLQVMVYQSVNHLFVHTLSVLFLIAYRSLVCLHTDRHWEMDTHTRTHAHTHTNRGGRQDKIILLSDLWPITTEWTYVQFQLL